MLVYQGKVGKYVITILRPSYDHLPEYGTVESSDLGRELCRDRYLVTRYHKHTIYHTCVTAHYLCYSTLFTYLYTPHFYHFFIHI